jgi:hypothetical protein
MVIRAEDKKVGHVACTGEVRNSYKIVVNKPKRKKCLEGLGIDG